MKYFVGIIAVLAALFCEGEGSFAEELNSTISKIHDIKLSLESYKPRITQQESFKFQVVLEAAQRMGITTVGAALQNWEDEQCKKLLISQAPEIVKVVDAILKRCFGDNLPRWGSYAYQIDKLINVGKTIEAQGDILRKACSESSDDLETCLETNLPFLTNLAKYYENAEVELIIKVQVDSGSAFMQTGACIQRSTDNIFTEIENTIEDKEVLQCLNATNSPQLMRSVLI